MYRLLRYNVIMAVIAVICFMTTGCSEAVTVLPSDNHIQYFGRWEKSEKEYSCGYGATYIKANFYGTGITAFVDGPHGWWRYSVDGEPFEKFAVEDGEIVMADGLELGEHSVMLVRSTEGEAGINVFKGFNVQDGYMLEPSPAKSRRMEFVGDSITAGACNDGPQEANWHDKEDNDMSFGPQLARMLDADYSVVAKSGEGVLRNYDETEPPYKLVHTADRYAWSFYSSNFNEEHKTWNFEEFPVDVVVIAIGTNDFSWGKPKPDKKAFIASYENLIKVIRQYNPRAKIICTEPLPCATDRTPSEWIEAAIRNVADSEVCYIPLNEGRPLLAADDYVGDYTHPTSEGSRKLAIFLNDKVKKIMNW